MSYDAENGLLYWEPRAREHFNNERAFASWNARYAGKEAFTALNSEGYKNGSICGFKIKAHRLIWFLVHGVEAAYLDHVNGDKTDNRIANLSVSTLRLNARNRKKPINNTSGVIGVHQHRDGRYDAFIRNDQGRQINLGRFSTIEQATRARKGAESFYGYHVNHGRSGHTA